MECTECGERMQLDDPAQLMFDYFEGAPEIRELFTYAVEHPDAQVWSCFGCGHWMPTVIP